MQVEKTLRTEIGDQELLRRFHHHRSEDAFRQIYQHYYPLVYSLCRGELREKSLAEDAAQLVFILLAQKAKSVRWDHSSSLAGWLIRSSRYTCRNIGRLRKQQLQHEIYTTPKLLETVSSEPNQLNSDLGHFLIDALSSLRKTECNALILRYFDELEFSEIGSRLGVSESAARMRVKRAADQVRKYLDRRGIKAQDMAQLLALPNLKDLPSSTSVWSSIKPILHSKGTSVIMQSKVRIGLFVALGCTSVLTVGFASFGFSKLAQSSAERSRREKDYPPIVLSESEAKKLDQLTSDMTIKPGIGVGPVRLMMTPEQVIEVLGKPEVRTDDPKRRQTMLAYRKLGLRMEFDRGSEELWAIICMASSKKTLFSQSSDPVATFGGATAEGVKIGLPFAEAKRILGEPLVSQKYPMLDMFPKDDNVIDPNSILESAYPKSLMVLVKDQKDIVEIHVVLPGHKNKPLDFR